MFFQAINQMITAGTDLSINIRRVNNNLTVAVVPRRSGVKDGKYSINSLVYWVTYVHNVVY